MKVDVCIPAYNEARIIADSVRRVQNVMASRGIDAHICVVDNGSTDGTANAVVATGASVLRVDERGKGAAVISCARASQADTFCFIDADLSADPGDMSELLELIRTDACDIAIGSRLLNTHVVRRGVFRTFTSKVFNTLQRLIVGVGARDVQCGLKCMNVKGRALLATCEEKGWFFDMELLARAEKSGLRVKEVPVHWQEDRYKGRKSKLRLLRDGAGALRAMFRIRKMLR